MTVHFNIEVGETGPDWEPTPDIKFYASIDGGTFGFGPTPGAAVRAVIAEAEKKGEIDS